jgi:hypothetical protein
LREPDQRRPLIGQQAEAKGIGQQLSGECSLVSVSHQPPNVTAEESHVSCELLGLGSSLVMTEMPEPALMHCVTDQDLPSFVQGLPEPGGQ